MPVYRSIFLLCFIFGLVSAVAGAAPSAEALPADTGLKGYHEQGGQGSAVYEVSIDGTIDLGLAAFVERIADKAKEGDRIIVRIKTFGGRVDAAVRIRDALLGVKAVTVAYVDRRAISAGALITLACATIIMSEGASIGAATPVQGGAPGAEAKPTSEKVVSYMRAEIRATAEAKGRRADVAEAMVDADIEVKGLSEKGKLLTLTSKQALEVKVADALAPSYEAALQLLNLGEAETVKTETHWAEKISRILTDPSISSLLMSFGFIGLLMELYTPGFGVGGIIGVTCLSLFFLGQYAAHLAGWEEAIILGVGVLLMALEILVLPGFGVAGILGLGFLLVGFVMGMIEFGIPLEIAFELGYAQETFTLVATRLAITVVVGLVAAAFIMRRLPKMKAAKWMILDKVTADEDGFVSTPKNFEGLLGARGWASSDLRPSGIADFEGRRFDVQTQGGFISSGAEIEVIDVDGTRLLVKQVDSRSDSE